jgi:hypothetical protein
VANRDRPVIPSSTGSGGSKDRISGALGCTMSSVWLQGETTVGRRTEEVGIEVSQADGAIVSGEGLSRAAPVL